MSKFEAALGKWFDLVMKKKLAESGIATLAKSDVDLEEEKVKPKKKIIQWDDIKNDVLQVLKKQSGLTEPNITMVDGIISSQFLTEMNNSPMLGGPTIPMVAVINDDSGQLYFYALKALIKELDI